MPGVEVNGEKKSKLKTKNLWVEVLLGIWGKHIFTVLSMTVFLIALGSNLVIVVFGGRGT